MNKILPLLGLIRAALYSGQKSTIKERAQRAFEQLCMALAPVEADARALWAVRVLDAWAERNEDDCLSARWNYHQGAMRWECPDHRAIHYGSTPDAARIAAATALVAADPSLNPG